MKFVYLDVVMITDGFYKGYKGKVIEHRNIPKSHYIVKLSIDEKKVIVIDEWLKGLATTRR